MNVAGHRDQVEEELGPARMPLDPRICRFVGVFTLLTRRSLISRLSGMIFRQQWLGEASASSLVWCSQ
jgi:hypothetical protein